MTRPCKDTEQITLRVQRDWLAEADGYRELMAMPGMPLGRTDVFRMAIALGFKEFRALAKGSRAMRRILGKGKRARAKSATA